MNPRTINHLNIRAALHETESISHVSCKDIRDLLEERNLLIATLQQSLAVFNVPEIDPLQAFVMVEKIRHTLETTQPD